MLRKLHHQFTTRVLPVVTRWARSNFGRDDDNVAEAVALAWKWFRRMARRGKDGSLFPGTIARYAVRAVRSGRRVAGQLSAKDAMNPITWRRLGFTVCSLPECEPVST